MKRDQMFVVVFAHVNTGCHNVGSHGCSDVNTGCHNVCSCGRDMGRTS